MKEKFSSFTRQNVLIDPPSIGSKELSFDNLGNRVRQIVERVVDNDRELERILNNAGEFGKAYNSTRSIVRVLMDTRMSGVENVGGFKREAAIPLDAGFKGLSLCYYGMNSLERQTTVSIIEQERKILTDVLGREPKTPLAILEKTKEFKFERLEGKVSINDFERLREMYENSFTAYPFDIVSSLKSMIANQDYVVYVARSIRDGLLYSVSITEEMILDILGTGKLTMREMGDSAKIPQVNGLNAPLKLLLIEKAYEDEVNLVFCESRAALPAVNAVNRDIGMDYCGFLTQHTRIGGEGIDEKSPYGNMNVWALNKDAIQRIGQEVKLLTK